MLIRLIQRFAAFALLALALPAGAQIIDPADLHLTVLCYHEIAERKDALDPGYTTSPGEFERQVQWLRSNGYSFVSLDAVIAGRSGRRALPPKPVLLTFDDGYESFYRNAVPVLKRERIPSVVALVGSWLEVPAGGTVNVNGRDIPRHALMSWEEVADLKKSGLFEIASHSFAMHGGIPGNPQGNREPAATTRQWLAEANRYETEGEYLARVRSDLDRNSRLLKSRLKAPPRAIVWPYGRYNERIARIAAQLGMPVGLNLDDGPNSPSVPMWGLRRELVLGHETIAQLNYGLRQRAHNIVDEGRPTKAAHIDLDYIYDPDPAQTEKNLGKLLDRVQRLGINTVYLQAVADPDGNGAADAVYFPNRHLPMRADLFNRVAWQLTTRTQVKRVYAWMPLLAWQLPAGDPAARDVVVTLPNKANHVAMGYPRLSPFSPRARQVVREIYEDLGRAATFDGVLFHDDVTLSDYEDGSSFALKQYRAWGLRQPLEVLRTDPKLLRRWTDRKIAWLDDYALEMAKVVRSQLPGLLTARNLYAQVALNPESETWYAQSLKESVRRYDYTAIMVMPYMEQAPDRQAFYRQMFDRVKALPNGIENTVFELQAVNWRDHDQPLPPEEVPDTIRMLYQWGVKHVGWYPDNVFNNVPDAERMREVLKTKPESPPGNRLE